MSDPVETSRVQFDRQAACYGRAHILRDVSDVVEALEALGQPASRQRAREKR